MVIVHILRENTNTVLFSTEMLKRLMLNQIENMIGPLKDEPRLVCWTVTHGLRGLNELTSVAAMLLYVSLHTCYMPVFLIKSFGY